jgi:uncharacterized sulfatase
MLVSMPGTIAPADYPTLVSSIDIAPTVLAAAGLPKSKTMPGLNLLEVIAEHGHTSRTTVFGEIFDHTVVDIDDPIAGLQFRWCVDGNWKLILPTDHPQASELYDVLADPLERQNLAAAQPEIVRKLTEELDEWWQIKK